MKSETATMSDWVSTKEAGCIIGCSQNTVFQMVRRGNFPNAVMVGHSIMIPLKEVQELKVKREARKEKRLIKLKKPSPKKPSYKYPDRSEYKVQT